MASVTATISSAPACAPCPQALASLQRSQRSSVTARPPLPSDRRERCRPAADVWPLAVKIEHAQDRFRRAERKCGQLPDTVDALPLQARIFDRLVTRSAINTASARAVEPSYIDAFATSIPVSWQTSV